MKNLLRAAAIAVASTALVAGGTSAVNAAPVAASTAATVTTTGGVSAAVAPYPLDYKSKIRVKKVGKKLTFRVTARYRDDLNNPVGIRRATIQVWRGGKWKNLKHVKLTTKGTGTYKRSDRKKRNYRLVIKATSLYQGGVTDNVKI